MMLAAFSTERFTNDASLAITFMASEFFVNVVMLNALIAIMGNTYARVSEQAQARGLYNKAMYILERQSLMPSSRQRDPRLFPAWLHVLQRHPASETAKGAGASAAHMSGQAGTAADADLLGKLAAQHERFQTSIAAQLESHAAVIEERITLVVNAQLQGVRQADASLDVARPQTVTKELVVAAARKPAPPTEANPPAVVPPTAQTPGQVLESKALEIGSASAGQDAEMGAAAARDPQSEDPNPESNPLAA